MLNTLLDKFLSVRSKRIGLVLAIAVFFYFWVKLLGTIWAFVMWPIVVILFIALVDQNINSIRAGMCKTSKVAKKVLNWFSRPGL